MGWVFGPIWRDPAAKPAGSACGQEPRLDSDVSALLDAAEGEAGRLPGLQLDSRVSLPFARGRENRDGALSISAPHRDGLPCRCAGRRHRNQRTASLAWGTKDGCRRRLAAVLVGRRVSALEQGFGAGLRPCGGGPQQRSQQQRANSQQRTHKAPGTRIVTMLLCAMYNMHPKLMAAIEGASS